MRNLKTFNTILKLRNQALQRDNFICTFCGKKGTDVNMGIGPNKEVPDGTKLGLKEVVSLHEKCNGGYYA